MPLSLLNDQEFTDQFLHAEQTATVGQRITNTVNKAKRKLFRLFKKTRNLSPEALDQKREKFIEHTKKELMQ